MPVYCYEFPDGTIIEKIFKYSERPNTIEVNGEIGIYVISPIARTCRNWGSSLIYGLDGQVSQSLQGKRITSDASLEQAYKDLNVRPATQADVDKALSKGIEKQEKIKKTRRKESEYQKMIADGAKHSQALSKVYGAEMKQRTQELAQERKDGKRQKIDQKAKQLFKK